MIELFKLYNINNTFTDSYRLQQNWIAEAFWKYIEHHYESEDDIPDTIMFYNDAKPHTSLLSSIINEIHISHNPGYEYHNSVKYNGIVVFKKQWYFVQNKRSRAIKELI